MLTRFVGRPAGDDSKLSTVKDGTRILRLNLRLFRDARPSLAFTLLAIPWFLATLWCAFVVWRNYDEAGTIISIPNLMGCFVFFMIGLTLLIAGITMERITRNRNEAVLLAHLAQALVPALCEFANCRAHGPNTGVRDTINVR